MKYKKYPKVKDSGVEWIGEIPEGWEVKKLKFVANFDNSTVDRHVYDDEIPVSISHYPQVYHNETISLKTELPKGTCSQKEFENFFLTEFGYIFKTIKKNDWKIICNTSIISPQVINNFLFFLKF